MELNARERDRQRQKRGVETETWLTHCPRLGRQVVMKTDEEEYPVQAVLLEEAETQAVEKVRVLLRNRPLRLPARRLLLIATRRLRAPPLPHPLVMAARVSRAKGQAARGPRARLYPGPCAARGAARLYLPVRAVRVKSVPRKTHISLLDFQ